MLLGHSKWDTLYNQILDDSKCAFKSSKGEDLSSPFLIDYDLQELDVIIF